MRPEEEKGAASLLEPASGGQNPIIEALLLNLESRIITLIPLEASTVCLSKESSNGHDPHRVISAGPLVEEISTRFGCSVTHLRLIAHFHLPGEEQRELRLYFSTVRVSPSEFSTKGPGSTTMMLEELFDRLESGSLDRADLLIGSYWLKRELAQLEERERILRSVYAAPSAEPGAAEMESAPLGPLTVRYSLKEDPRLIIGYKTGPIENVKGIKVWVNSENTDMMMDRFVGRTISAQIRFLGANKDRYGNVVEDTIADALSSSIGSLTHVNVGTVVMTDPGLLKSTHGVRKLVHVAVLEGGPGSTLRASIGDLGRCLQRVLIRVEEENSRLWRLFLRLDGLNSILIPFFGTGNGGVSVGEAAHILIPTAVSHLENSVESSLNEIYFLAYRSSDKIACDRALERLCADGRLLREGGPSRS